VTDEIERGHALLITGFCQRQLVNEALRPLVNLYRGFK
jgi:hypothetical protein